MKPAGLPKTFVEKIRVAGPGDAVQADFRAGAIRIGEREFAFEPLPAEMTGIIEERGLVTRIKGVER